VGKTALILVNLAVFAVLVLALELGARAFFPRSLEGLFNDPQVFLRRRPFVEAHPERGLALRPGHRGERYRINQAGFRGSELPEDLDGRALVLILGESSTFGWLEEEAASFPAQLQTGLDEAGLPSNPLVINAGVPSYTSAQVDLYLEELLRRYAPALVLVNVFWNDALFACLDNWMPEYLIIQQPKPWRQFLLRYSAVYRAATLKEPRIGPLEGRVENPEALRTYEHHLTSMVRRCRSKGVPIRFVQPCVDPSSIPREGMRIWRQTVSAPAFMTLLHDFEGVLENVLREQGTAMIPSRLAGERPENTEFFLDPVHLNREGNRILAEDIAAYLLQEELLGRGTRPLAASPD
jgi:lysophospholipase L1-like esterase